MTRNSLVRPRPEGEQGLIPRRWNSLLCGPLQVQGCLQSSWPQNQCFPPQEGGGSFLSPHTCCGQGCRHLCPLPPGGPFVATPGSSPRFQGRSRCPGVGSQRPGFALHSGPSLLILLTGGNTVPGHCGSWESGLAMPELGVPGGCYLIGRGSPLLPGSICLLPPNQ